MDVLNSDLLDSDLYSNATGTKDLQTLTGCKKPRQLTAIATMFLGNPIKALKDQKKYKADMVKYKACIESYKSKLEGANNAKAQAELREAEATQRAEDAKRELEETKNTLNDSNRSSSTEESGEEKFLWLPKKAGITVAIIGGVAILGGIILGIKHFAKK